MIERARFNPLSPDASQAMARLRRFHAVVAYHSTRYFQTLTINDGAAAYRDLSYRNRSVGHDFLSRAWKLYQDIQENEHRNKHPGARMILATGFRMRGRRAGIDKTSRNFKSIMRRYQSGAIGAEQAIQQAAAIRQPFDIVPQLQANFAFTKAYLAESSGSKGGFGGPGFFVDESLFRSSLPSWISSDGVVEWKSKSPEMSGNFIKVRDIRKQAHPEGGPVEIRDGLEVAQHLASDENILQVIRASRK